MQTSIPNTEDETNDSFPCKHATPKSKIIINNTSLIDENKLHNSIKKCHHSTPMNFLCQNNTNIVQQNTFNTINEDDEEVQEDNECITEFRQCERDSEPLNKIKKPLDDSLNLSNSSKKLLKVIDDFNLVKQYDKYRKSIKSGNKSKELYENYKICVAKIEVLIKITKDKLKTKLKSIELDNLNENESGTIVMKPTDTGSTEYNDSIKKLQIIKIIIKELQLN